MSPPLPQRWVAGTRWVLYGAGGRGEAIHAYLKAKGVEVVAFLDQGAIPGQVKAGVPVFRLDSDEARGLTIHPVLISVFNYTASLSPISTALQCAGFGEIATFLDLHAAFAAELGDFFWLTDRDAYAGLVSDYQEFSRALEDDRSRAVLGAILEMRLRGDWRPSDALVSQITYFPDDVPLPNDLRLIDGGACVGDCLTGALAAGKKLEAVFAFEPDPANFEALSSEIASGKLGDFEAALWPSGLWSQSTQLRFAAGQGMASKLDDAGDILVSVVAIDEVLPCGGFNFLKLDIEGAELEALAGARLAIQRDKPVLALCVYHRPQDMIDIWRFVAGLEPSYKFYLRSHEFNGFDTVLYAVVVGGDENQ